jgi:hypothetical protein
MGVCRILENDMLLEGQQVLLQYLVQGRLLWLPPDVGRPGGLALGAGRCRHNGRLSVDPGRPSGVGWLCRGWTAALVAIDVKDHRLRGLAGLARA